MTFVDQKSIIISILIALFLGHAQSSSTAEIRELVSRLIAQTSCSDGSKNILFSNQYKAAKVVQRSNQKLKLFSTPFEIQHDYSPRTYLVYETETEDAAVFEAQLNLIFSKMTNFKELSQALGSDFSASGVRHFYECFYMLAPSTEMKIDVISVVAVEVARVTKNLDPTDPTLTAQDRLRLSQQLTQTFAALDARKVYPFGLRATDIQLITDEKKRIFPRLKYEKLNCGTQDISTKLKKELSALKKADAYQFPPEFAKKFIFEKRFANSFFNKSYNQWRLALILSEIWGIDFREFFATNVSCPNYYVDWKCVAAFALHVSNRIEESIKNGDFKVNNYEPVDDFATIMGSAIATLMSSDPNADWQQLAANMELNKLL